MLQGLDDGSGEQMERKEIIDVAYSEVEMAIADGQRVETGPLCPPTGKVRQTTPGVSEPSGLEDLAQLPFPVRA